MTQADASRSAGRLAGPIGTLRTGRVASRALPATLALLACLGATGPLTAQDEVPEEGVRRVVRDASRALQSGNPSLFMAAFDRTAFDGFRDLREQVGALAAQRRIASSVVSGPPDCRDAECVVQVDWLLELTPKLTAGSIEQRRETIALTLSRRGGRWRIVRLEPTAFFSTLRRAGR